MPRALLGVAGLVVGCTLLARDASADRSVTSWAIARLGASAATSMAGKESGEPVQALVALPPGIDAIALGLRPLLPGVAVLSGDSARVAGFVLAHPDLRVDVAPPLRPKLDRAVPYIAAERARLEGIGPGGVTLDGRGVYVGIVDTGLDVTHADFRAPDGSTRVAWLLDFSMKARPGNALDEKYGGRVFDRRELQALLDAKATTGLPDDPEGHGTHVAGIAAGNGGLEKIYVGVAPAADLVIVRATRDESGSIDEADAIAGAAFVFDVAAKDGVPAVVNLSLGSQFGPHDGTSTFETSLARLAKGPGRAIIVAASNEGGTPIHTSLRVSPGVEFEIPIRLDGADGHGAAYRSAQVFAWLNLRDDGDVHVGLKGPDGEEWLDDVGKGEGVEARPDGLLVQIVNDVGGKNGPIPGGTHGAIVTFRGALPVGDYTLVLEGDGAIEAWLQGVGGASDGPGAAYFPQGGQIEGTIGVPASSEALIAVGCVGFRRSYRKGVLKEFLTPEVPPGTRCFFSSAGPSATGALRPDLLAPGYFVISSLARTAYGKIPLGEFGPDQVVDGTHEHAALSGTSMSTPFVTGATALLFQKDPTLTHENVRALLQAGARSLTDDASPPLLLRDYAKGAGILDVEGALAALDRKGASPAARTMQLRIGASYLASDGGQPMHALVLARADDGRPADFSSPPKVTFEGAVLRGPIEHAATGLYRFALLPQDGARLAVIHVNADGLSVSREVPIAADRWDARFGLAAGGGCAFSTVTIGDDGRARFGSLSLSLAVAALAVTRLRRRRARSRAAAPADRRGARGTPDRRC
ncbi:MAG: S8 family serine peptidase [Polyangiales bacterium]